MTTKHSNIPMNIPKNSGDIAWSKKTKKIKGVTHTAVLYSAGFGAGWSTWNQMYASFLMFDKGIVERVLKEDKDSIPAYIESKLGKDEVICIAGLDSIAVAWVPQGVKFLIEEYDGSESIVRYEHLDFQTA